MMAQGARRHICPTPNTTQPEEKEWNTQARLQAPRTATIWGQDPNHSLTTRVDAYRPPRSTTQTTMSTLRQLHGIPAFPLLCANRPMPWHDCTMTTHRTADDNIGPIGGIAGTIAFAHCGRKGTTGQPLSRARIIPQQHGSAPRSLVLI